MAGSFEMQGKRGLIPEALARTAYGRHITEFIVPGPAEHRIIPSKITGLITEVIGGSAGENVLRQLRTIQVFLETPIIFDSLKDDERERARDELMKDSTLYTYYERNPLRINRITEVIDAVDALLDYANPVLRRVSFGNLKAVPEELIAMTKNTWKKIKAERPEITVAEHNKMKEQFVLGLLTVLSQLVFDATVFTLNNNEPISTMRDNSISPDMSALVEARKAMHAKKQPPQGE